MITIDFDETSHLSKISNQNSPHWITIRRIIEDNSPLSVLDKPDEIQIPWWCFLKIRSILVSSLKINSIDFILTDAVKSHLVKAQSNENEYLKPKKSEGKSKDKLHDELRKKGFTRTLTEHQTRNVMRLIQHSAAATFSVPGAGKTTEAIAYFTLKKSEGDKLIVVAPRNAFSSWEEEFEKCIPKNTPSIMRLRGSLNIPRQLESTYDVFLTTYQQFYRIDPIIGDFLNRHPSFLFLDESHRIKKRPYGAYGSSILSVCHLPKNKLIMTGTPLPNELEDLMPQFTYLYPEISVSETNVVSRFEPIYVRTTKTELGIKPPIRSEWKFDMNPAQRRLYDNLIDETRRIVDGIKLNDRALLHEISKCVVRLIQVTTDPSLLIKSELADHELLNEAIAEGNGVKVDEACHFARRLANENQKTIIWSQFVNTVESVSDLLSDLGAEYIHGGRETDEDEANMESRESIIRRFHDDDDCMVLVANPAACAEGISLHKVCHNAIYIDRNYNAAHYLQSEDRIHRLGLAPDQDTYIHLLTCNNSIDDAISDRLELKIRRMGLVLNDSGLRIEPIQVHEEKSGLSMDDLESFKKHILGD